MSALCTSGSPRVRSPPSGPPKRSSAAADEPPLPGAPTSAGPAARGRPQPGGRDPERPCHAAGASRSPWKSQGVASRLLSDSSGSHCFRPWPGPHLTSPLRNLQPVRSDGPTLSPPSPGRAASPPALRTAPAQCPRPALRAVGVGFPGHRRGVSPRGWGQPWSPLEGRNIYLFMVVL